jgi:Ca2+-binding EF-hand superfamily protein
LGAGVDIGQNAISFDLFVQSCISLKRMTEVFKKYDDDRDGYVQKPPDANKQ